MDVVPEKVKKINNKKSLIKDDYIEKYLAEKVLDLTATLDGASAYKDAEYVIIAAPTNYDSASHHFDTSAVETVNELVMKNNPNACMIIKSTIPVGYTDSMRKNTEQTKYCLVQNSRESLRLFMTIFILLASSFLVMMRVK